MVRFVFVVGTAMATSFLGVSASAENGPQVLEPSSQWNVDFAPNKCRLSRTFGEGDNLHLLFFEQHFPSTQTGLTVAGPSFKRFKSRKRTSVSFFSDQEPLRTEPFAGDVDSVGSAIIYSSVDLETGTGDRDDYAASVAQLDTQFAAKTEFVALTQGSKTVSLQTGPLGEAFAVLNQCTQSLLRDWGLDVEKHITAQAMPQWENEAKVTKRIAAVYPRAALVRGEQAIVRMRVNVDETGSVTDCVINEATTADRLESPACKAMEKAKFTPAIDAEGKPFKSYYATSIIYRMRQ